MYAHIKYITENIVTINPAYVPVQQCKTSNEAYGYGEATSQ